MVGVPTNGVDDVVFNKAFDVAPLPLKLPRRAHLSPEVHVELGRRADPDLHC